MQATCGLPNARCLSARARKRRFATCASRTEGVPCAVNSVDVGIAVGSACSKASDYRVDTRVLFSGGLAAQRLELLGEGVRQVYAIPVSISSKSPFFDRK